MSRQVGCTLLIPEIGACRAGVLRVPAAFTPSHPRVAAPACRSGQAGCGSLLPVLLLTYCSLQVSIRQTNLSSFCTGCLELNWRGT